MKSNRFWVIVLCGVLLGAAVAAVMLRQRPANEACVYQDGVLIECLDLFAAAGPYSFTVESEAGVNVIAVENGRIRVSEADCPDGFCVRQGWIGGGTAPIVCLPHRLVIKPGKTGAPDVDAVSR